MGFSRQKYWSGVTLPSPKVRTSPVLNHLLSLFPNLIITDQEEKEINIKHSLNTSNYYRANFPYTHFGKLSGLK